MVGTTQLLTFLTVISSLSIAAIPDRVNIQKYNDLYQQQKQVSDKTRAHANEKNDEYKKAKAKLKQPLSKNRLS